MSVSGCLSAAVVVSCVIAVTAPSASQLHQAVSAQDIEGTRTLMTPSQELNERDSGGMAPIHFAVLEGRVELVKMLLHGGADANIVVDSSNADVAHYVSLHQFSPLHIAANRDSLDVADLLITWGANINQATDDQRSPLHIAAGKGNQHLARLLIANGADVNARDFEGYTPLHSAACFGRLAVIEVLLANGADVTASGDDGRSAYDCAVDRNQPRIVSYLERIGITT